MHRLATLVAGEVGQRHYSHSVLILVIVLFIFAFCVCYGCGFNIRSCNCHSCCFWVFSFGGKFDSALPLWPSSPPTHQTFGEASWAYGQQVSIILSRTSRSISQTHFLDWPIIKWYREAILYIYIYIYICTAAAHTAAHTSHHTDTFLTLTRSGDDHRRCTLGM